MKAVGKFLLVVIAFIVASSVVSGVVNNVSGTGGNSEQAFKNTFINSCVSGGGESSFCGCAYTKLVEMHPDLRNNSQLTKRILTEGYNQSETDAMLSCI